MAFLDYKPWLFYAAENLVGGQDNTSALQAAFNFAKVRNVPLAIPPASNGLPYKCSASLSPWSGAVISNYGVIDFQTDHSATGVGLFLGDPVSGIGISQAKVSGFRCISSNASARNGVYGLVSLFGCTDVILEDLRVGSSTANNGGESTGLFTSNCVDLFILRPRIQNTLADGIHLSRQTLDTVIDHPVVIGAQDDGIGVVSVKQDGSGPIYGPCQYIEIIQPIVRNSTVLGNGVTLVGAQDCTVVGGSVDTVPNRIFAVARANYGGIIDPARNTISGITGKNAGSSSQGALVGNATDTTVENCILTSNPGGLQVIGSANTSVTGNRISSTGAGIYGVYDDSASSRTIVDGNILVGNSSGAALLQGTGSSTTLTNITS